MLAGLINDAADRDLDIPMLAGLKNRDQPLFAEFLSNVDTGFDHSIGTDAERIARPQFDRLFLTVPPVDHAQCLPEH